MGGKKLGKFSTNFYLKNGRLFCQLNAHHLHQAFVAANLGRNADDTRLINFPAIAQNRPFSAS